MDSNNNGQPNPKRPRTQGSQGPHFARNLPNPISQPPSTPYGHINGLPPYNRPTEPHLLDRRHSEHITTQAGPYEQEHSRPRSGPHHYPPLPPPPPLPPGSSQASQQPSPYGGQQRDAAMVVKREHEADAAAHSYRPASTGGGPEHHTTATTHPAHRHPDGRYPGPVQQGPVQLPPFDIAQHPHGPQSYRPPQFQAPPSPMHANDPYGHPAVYSHQGVPPQRELPGVSYPSTAAANTQKRKAQRAAQACDNCRSLKAKCDEMRPCSSCHEKGIICVYRDPPPKPQDKTISDFVEAMKVPLSEHTQRIESIISHHLSSFEARLRLLESERYIPKQENEEAKPQVLLHHLPAHPEAATEQQARPPVSTAVIGDDHGMRIDSVPNQEDELAESVEDEDGEPVVPGPSSIPINHTTGNARLLLVKPISILAHGIMRKTKIKNEKYPMLQEERRGLLRLYGRHEGTDRIPGYDKDHLTDYEGATPTASDRSSDTAPSPPGGEEWGYIGPTVNSVGEPVQRGPFGLDGMPDFTPKTVRTLAASYMDHMNILHPIFTPKKLDILIEHFFRTMRESERSSKQAIPPTSTGRMFAGFVAPAVPSPTFQYSQVQRNSESPGNKRKRSPTLEESSEPTSQAYFKSGHPVRSITSAIVLLIMALGAICQHKTPLPGHDSHESDDAPWDFPIAQNGLPPSPPSHASPAISTPVTLPSPLESDKAHPRSRRTSIEGTSAARTTSGIKARNMDVIPGLVYFAFATDIIGNQAGGNSLQHVHANILASLYHGQLCRPLESHAYLSHACRSLQTILRPKLDRFKKLKTSLVAPGARDNPLIFAFWTCLQLESDIVAELPVPRSNILTYEDDMPGPNIIAAQEIDGLDELIIKSYSAQLYLRKQLNSLHSMFYRPESDAEYSGDINAKEKVPKFPSINAVLISLSQIDTVAPMMRWRHGDPPATEILGARLRAKYYGAKVITFRHFLLRILEHSHALAPQKSDKRDGSTPINSQQHMPEEYIEPFKAVVHDIPVLKNPVDDPDPRFKEYAVECINALIASTTAFYGMGNLRENRLIITNLWGTAHAQWGNVLTLLAAYKDPILGPSVPKDTLTDILHRTIEFLKCSSSRSSALATDFKILEHVGREVGLYHKISGQINTNSSFSSTTSAVDRDVYMSGY